MRGSRGMVRGRRLLASNKPKKTVVAPSKPLIPKPISMESYELDKSFDTCAYPSPVEIFKLSEQLDLSRSAIKLEFKKRRQDFRQRNSLPEDAIIYSYSLPWIFIPLNFVSSQLDKSKGSLVNVAIFMSSMLSVWYSACCKIGHQYSFNEELLLGS